MQEFWVLIRPRPVSFGVAEMWAGLDATAETREALNQSASTVIQNLEASLANSTTPFLQEGA